jgi:hypothetical protein
MPVKCGECNSQFEWEQAAGGKCPVCGGEPWGGGQTKSQGAVASEQNSFLPEEDNQIPSQEQEH